MNKLFLITTILLTAFLAACRSQPAAPVSPSNAAAAPTAAPAAAPLPASEVPRSEAATPMAVGVPAQPADKTANNGGQIANPASKNCIEKGGKLDIRSDSSGGQFGVCVFPSGKECEEWALMRGQCGPENGSANAGTAYRNVQYGFTFNYPQAWKLQETAGTPLTVTLTNGNHVLRLQVKRVSENASFAADAPQGGEISQQGSLVVLGQVVPLQVVTLEGKLKSAAVNLRNGEVLFRFQLDDSADPEISADRLQEVQGMITSLQILK